MPWQTGPLKQEPDDPFRIVTRSVAPAMQVRELAGVAVMAASADAKEDSLRCARGRRPDALSRQWEPDGPAFPAELSALALTPVPARTASFYKIS